MSLQPSFDETKCEIGVDEAGRGPLFGPVYAAAVVLPHSDFDHGRMKDSKKFTSKKKIEEVAEYIKQHAVAWAVASESEAVIDEINILQATQSAMHKAIRQVLKEVEEETHDICLLIDGNYFKPLTFFEGSKWHSIPHQCIEGGDNKYSCIAAASILAKVSRDQYIEQLCEANPDLKEKYGIDRNKGYGAKRHLDGIHEHGITPWHRRSFGICKTFV